MRLTRFMVQGFKNFVEPVKLEDMGPLVVLHGANNVGKSNLIEAIELAFRLLGAVPAHLYNDAHAVSEPGLADAFTKGREDSIRWEVMFEFPPDESVVSFSLQLESKLGSNATFKVTDVALNGVEVKRGKPEEGRLLNDIWPHLRHNFAVRRPDVVPQFQILHVSRGFEGSSREVVPKDVLLALYDAQEAPEAADRRAWSTFQSALTEFSEPLGTTTFRANYERARSRAGIVFDHGDFLIPLRLEGTGIQQVVTVLGTLATCGASIVAIEEPEGNLSFANQQRLHRALRAMAEDPGPPDQIIVTSHSPGVALADHFFHLVRTPNGPAVHRRAMTDAPAVVGLDLAGAAAPSGRAPVSVVTDEGLVVLPDFVRDGLGVRDGGGLGFLKEKDREGFRLLNSERFLEAVGIDDEEREP